MTRVVHVVCANSIAREGLGVLIAAQGFAVGQTVESVADLLVDAADESLALVADFGEANQPLAVRELAGVSPRLRTVVLSTIFEFDVMVACFREGARGYLIKDMSVHALVGALNMVASGQKVLPSILADRLSRPADWGRPPQVVASTSLDEMDMLSSRERSVLCCLMSGSSNKAIAKHLNVSEATIKVNVKSILRKLNVSNRTQAAIWARQQGALGQPMAEGARAAA